MTIVPQRRSLLRLALTLLVCPCSWGAEPDFSGEWTLDQERTVLGRAPSAPCSTMKIDHRDGRLIAAGLFAPCPEPHAPLFTNQPKETRASAGGLEMRTILKWQGDALLFNTIVNGSGGSLHTRMDRWRLSRDGLTLRIRRQFVTRRGEAASELVYRRRRPAP